MRCLDQTFYKEEIYDMTTSTKDPVLVTIDKKI